MQRSRLFVLDQTPAGYRPLIQVIDNFARNHKLGLVFEGRSGEGRLLVCGLDLPNMTQDPAARQLLASLYAYASSPAFQPQQPLGDDLLERLFRPEYSSKLQALEATIRADNVAGEDYEAVNVMDGKPDTMWHTAWDEPAPSFPHCLIIDLPRPGKLAGLACLPRQDGNRNGWVKDYAVYTSGDGKDWGQPVAQGAFQLMADWQTVEFSRPIETRHLKFVALSSFDASKPFASLAELDVVLAP